MRVGEVDYKIAAALGYRGADVDVVVAATVVVEQGLAPVDAVLPLRDDRPGLALGAVEYRLDRRIGDGPAELGCERQQAPLADMRRADHCGEITAEVAGVAHIGRDHLEEVAAHLAAIAEPQRRDTNAFLPDVGRRSIVGAMRRSADVALMRPIDRPEAWPVALKHRRERRQVGQVVAAVIGVVEQKDIALVNVVAEEFGHRPRREGQRPDMDRHMLGLGDQPTVEVADRGREVAARIEDL